MFWQENDDDENQLPNDVVDVLFDLSGNTIPLDHGYQLGNEIAQLLPWFETDEHCGLHHIYVAASGNGWERPDATEGESMYISRRTKLILRLPKSRIPEAEQGLAGKEVELDGHQLTIGKSKIRNLTNLTTLSCRYVIADPADDENVFMHKLVDQLRDMGVRVKKLMCGKSGTISTPDGPVSVRSVMIADLSKEESNLLQREGIGPGRHMGCGLFVPHKGIEEVNSTQEFDR